MMQGRRVRLRMEQLFLEDCSHGPFHGRLPVRQHPNRGGREAISGRYLPLHGLPETSRSTVPCFGDISRECSDDSWRASQLDRKSTRLNSSHVKISYAV